MVTDCFIPFVSTKTPTGYIIWGSKPELKEVKKDSRIQSDV